MDFYFWFAWPQGWQSWVPNHRTKCLAEEAESVEHKLREERRRRGGGVNGTRRGGTATWRSKSH